MARSAKQRAASRKNGAMNHGTGGVKVSASGAVSFPKHIGAGPKGTKRSAGHQAAVMKQQKAIKAKRGLT